MNQERLTPWEAYKNFIEDLTFSDFVWVVISIGLGVLAYWVGTKQIRRRTTSWKDVLFWSSFFGGWGFCLVIFGLPSIIKGGIISFGILCAMLALSFWGVFGFMRKGNHWVKVVYGIVIIIMVFGFGITFGLGATGWSYAILFGCLAGIILAMLVGAFQNLDHNTEGDDTDSGSSDEYEEWDFSKTKGA